MIAGAMAFASAVALLLGIAALLLEKTARLCALPRRGVCALALLASWLLPIGMMVHAAHTPGRVATSLSTAESHRPITALENQSIRERHPITVVTRWPRDERFDRALMILWGLASSTLFAIWGVAGFGLYRRARTWPTLHINGTDVLLADSFGPAVFGYLRPRIVMSKRLVGQSNSLRMIALQHEQSHIDARDPLLLFMGLLLAFLAPWNISLWWQLRRLRFAIEVDCDARVLRHGLGPAEYGEALLSISQQVVPLPLMTMAVTGPASQLERRVRTMMVTTVSHKRTLIALTLAAATSAVLAATALSAPVSSTASLIKPPPADGSHGPAETIATLVEERYPALLTQKSTGTPVVFALFNGDSTVEATAMEVFPGSADEFESSKEQFERFGISPTAIGFTGRQGIRTRSGMILVIYAERQSRPDTSRVFPDSRAIDRALTEHYFPHAFAHGVTAGKGIWILFDHDGSVLRAGDEPVKPTRLTRLLESRYPGIKVAAMTITPVTDATGRAIKNASGADLQLCSVWLAARSPLPGA